MAHEHDTRHSGREGKRGTVLHSLTERTEKNNDAAVALELTRGRCRNRATRHQVPEGNSAGTAAMKPTRTAQASEGEKGSTRGAEEGGLKSNTVPTRSGAAKTAGRRAGAGG